MKCTGLILDWPQELEQEHGADLGQCAQRELIDHKRTVVNTCRVLSWTLRNFRGQKQKLGKLLQFKSPTNGSILQRFLAQARQFDRKLRVEARG